MIEKLYYCCCTIIGLALDAAFRLLKIGD